MNYWDSNSSVIKDKFPGLFERLVRGEPAYGGDIRVEFSASGAPTLIIKGIYVHSPRDPVREGRRLAETLAETGPIVILGFGLGYAAEAAAEKAENRPIIIAESQSGLLRKTLETRDLRAFLSEHHIIFVLGEPGDGIIGALQFCRNRFPGKGDALSLIRNRALMKLDEPWYAEAERRLTLWTSKDRVNRATLRRFGKRWVRNLARNMTAIRDLPGINRLAGILRTLPAPIPVFLAAAGPSLDSIVPFLPEIRKRCVVVAVDTSLRLILEAGVDPDFAVVVDPQYWNSRHLDRAPAPRTCLIAESAVYPPVLGHPFERAFLCASLFPLGGFIEDRLDPKGRLGAGGSVATAAWDFARILGTSAVWIAGLDLSYPGFKTHYKGALFEHRALAESNRFNPLETWSVKALRDGRPFYGPSATGGSVLTDHRLSLYAAWFENRFQDAPEPRNYRLSGEGFAISGLITASIEELLALPVRRDEINQGMNRVFAQVDEDFNHPDRITRRSAQYQAVLKELFEGLERIKSCAEEAAETAESACRRFKSRNGKPEQTPAHQERERIFRKLDETNKRITESTVKDVAGFLFSPVPEPERIETASFSRYLESSAKLYRSLAEAAGYNLEVLRRFEN
ncbi:MAG: DUF115 domain-containing protein [Treponema sp.]|jgi:hypothetical protein|nr:DUF115 domain-containing protein [Treponema sp.]